MPGGHRHHRTTQRKIRKKIPNNKTYKERLQMVSFNSVYYGLSTDTKPETALNGMVFIEMDTSKVYFFDAEHGQWLEWAGDSTN